MRTAPPAATVTQIADAYKRMATEARYRPEAPSDGFGNITMPLEELDLDAEANAYAQRWWDQEEEATFLLGCANHRDRPPMIYALEAARLCCSGGDSPRFALQLAKMAVAELEQQLAEHKRGRR